MALLATPSAMSHARRTTIVGVSPANDCYLAVSQGRHDGGAVEMCSLALSDDFLPRQVRAVTYVNRSVLHLRRHESRQALNDANEGIDLQSALCSRRRRARLFLPGDRQRGPRRQPRRLRRLPACRRTQPKLGCAAHRTGALSGSLRTPTGARPSACATPGLALKPAQASFALWWAPPASSSRGRGRGGLAERHSGRLGRGASG